VLELAYVLWYMVMGNAGIYIWIVEYEGGESCNDHVACRIWWWGELEFTCRLWYMVICSAGIDICLVVFDER